MQDRERGESAWAGVNNPPLPPETPPSAPCSDLSCLWPAGLCIPAGGRNPGSPAQGNMSLLLGPASFFSFSPDTMTGPAHCFPWLSHHLFIYGVPAPGRGHASAIGVCSAAASLCSQPEKTPATVKVHPSHESPMPNTKSGCSAST